MMAILTYMHSRKSEVSGFDTGRKYANKNITDFEQVG